MKKRTEEEQMRLFKLTHGKLGLTEDDYGKRFSYNGKDYFVKYYNNRSKHYPIVCQSVETGKYFNFPSRVVEHIKNG
jgi:hypothetical protein